METDISATVRPIGMKVSRMIELRPGNVFFPFLVAISLGITNAGSSWARWAIFGLSDTDFYHFTANVLKTVIRSATFLKCM